MRIKHIAKKFEQGNVCVVGERGRGKDMLIANVIAYRNLDYISNVEYIKKRGLQPKYYYLDFDALDCGKNTYKEFMSDNVNYYEYPYPMGCDVYISDVGVYMPSQFCNELNRDYKYIPTFMALSRQLGNCNVHINVQNLNRAWDKLREQSRTYITCLGCKVIPLFGKQLVVQKIRLYEQYNACVQNVPKLKIPLYLVLGKDKLMSKLYKLNYKIQHGEIEEKTLIYWNRSNYDTNVFRAILKKGAKDDKENN